MTLGSAAMLAGLFAVPAALLWAGHRLRRRSARWRGAFWGALAAHVAVAPLAMLAAMLPPAEWSPDDRVRGFLGFWAMLVAPLLGAALGAVRTALGARR
jgi:hypothetical protein